MASCCPPWLLLITFHLLPVLYALFLSLFDARVFRDIWSPGPFIAGGNYVRLVTNAEFGQSLVNTVWYAGITVPLGVILAVAFAQLLNARIWASAVRRSTRRCASRTRRSREASCSCGPPVSRPRPSA